MTPHQTFAVAAIGGFAALLGLVLLVAVALGLHRLVEVLVDAHEQHRARRQDLATCHAIDDLPAPTRKNRP